MVDININEVNRLLLQSLDWGKHYVHYGIDSSQKGYRVGITSSILQTWKWEFQVFNFPQITQLFSEGIKVLKPDMAVHALDHNSRSSFWRHKRKDWRRKDDFENTTWTKECTRMIIYA